MARLATRGSETSKITALSSFAFAGSSVLGLTHYVKHGLFLKFYKSYIELHGSDGRPVELSTKIDAIVEEVSEHLLEKNLSSEYTPIVAFAIAGMNTFHAGTIGTNNGGIVGLPAFFEFSKEEDISDKLLIKNATEEDLDKLYSCFLLSDEAKKYAIAREILFISKAQVYWDTFLPIAVAYFMDIMARRLSNSGVDRFPLVRRGLFYIIFTFCGLYFWWFLHVYSRNYIQLEVEKEVTQLGKEYVEGGVEYCSKAIERNSLTVENKDESFRVVKLIGDFFFRKLDSFKEIPLASRRSFLKLHLEEQNKELN